MNQNNRRERMSMNRCMAHLYVLSLAAVLPSLAFAQGPYNFTEIVVPQSVETRAIGINNAGQIVGTYATAEDVVSEKEHGYLLEGKQLDLFDFPDSFDTDANGINDGGDIVGTYAAM